MTSTRRAQRPARAPHRTGRTTTTPLALAARSAPTVSALHIDTYGSLREVRVPTRATAWALAADLGAPGAPVAMENHRLDTDLVMWAAAADHVEDVGVGPRNPAALVAAASFGLHGAVRGPVVFTGWNDDPAGVPGGVIADVSVAAVILLAAIAASCDLTDRTAARAAEFARLGIDVVTPPAQSERESYDALAHTVTRPGDLPRCAECGEYRSCEEHQPEALAEQAEPPVAGVR